jgi:hypothetical protein
MIQKTYIRAEQTTKCRLTFTSARAHLGRQRLHRGRLQRLGCGGAVRCSKTRRAAGRPRWRWPPEQAYQFRYLCDGDWINDNQADDYYANEYGGHNSVVLTDADP